MKTAIDRSGADVAVRSFRQRGVSPTPVELVGLDTTADALAGLQARSPLVTVHPERRWPGTCHVGVVTRIEPDHKRFAFHEVSPSAAWDDRPTIWSFRDVRRIDIADSYAAALGALAGPPASPQ